MKLVRCFPRQLLRAVNVRPAPPHTETAVSEWWHGRAGTPASSDIRVRESSSSSIVTSRGMVASPHPAAGSTASDDGWYWMTTLALPYAPRVRVERARTACGAGPRGSAWQRVAAHAGL